MANTTFVILPSCSEGAATSVLTCMQWQCIPVITPQCGIVYPEAIVISDPSIQSVEKAVACCLALSQSECNARMRDAARWVAAEHNSRRYKTSLRNALSDILEEL
ncbi:MAG: hypothetical protein AAF669_00895 [Pseudomonadota bacterium]